MQTRNSTNLSSERLELARKCLRLIRDIAKRGASSCNADDVGYALQELSQVLQERTGMEDRLFEPIPADQIGNLRALYIELEFVDCVSQDLCAAHRCQ
jgi:hypothetical protein